MSDWTRSRRLIPSSVGRAPGLAPGKNGCPLRGDEPAAISPRIRRCALPIALVTTALLLPASAGAYTAAPGYSASDYATGFPFDSKNHWGPIGVAFDHSDNLYVGDYTDRNVYRFQPGGGVAGPTTLLNYPPIPGGIKGMAFTRSGHLFLARYAARDVVELSQSDGAVLRRVAGGLQCPSGLAADPISDDLFLSGTCTDKIVRISGFATGPGKVSTFATPPCCTDGIAFGPDGTLYAAASGQVMKIDGTNSSTPGLTRSLAAVPGADGIAVGRLGPNQSPFFAVNRTNGEVTRLDFSTTPPSQSPILTGGSRGDFVAVSSRGCLVITQTNSVVKIVPEGSRCDLEPSTPGAGAGSPPPGITVDTLASRKHRNLKCVRARRLVVRVRQHGRVRLKVVRVYVKGKHRKTLRRRRVTAPIFIKHVPRGKFTVKLVARTTKGKKLVAKRKYRNCKPRARHH
jgi:hypothetical protein